MLRRDRAALKNVGEAVLDGLIRPDPLLRNLWADHWHAATTLRKGAFLEKTNLAKLLFAHLLIG